MTAAETIATNRARETAAEKPFMARVRLRAQRRVLWMRSLWKGEAPAGISGMAIPHEEVDRVLESPLEIAARELEFYETDARARELTALVRTADEQASQDPAWNRLSAQFGLSAQEIDILALCAAAELDPPLRRVYAYLQDDAAAGHATCWLAAGLFQWGGAANPDADSPLVRWLIARPAPGSGNPWSATAPWTADPALVHWLSAGVLLDPALGASVHLFTAADAGRLLCLYPAERAAAQQFVLALRGAAPVEIHLAGPKGAGKRTLAAQISASLGRDLVCADAAALLGGDVPFVDALERVIRAARLARLDGAFLYWKEAASADPKVWAAVEGHYPVVFLGSPAPRARESSSTTVRQTIVLPGLTRSGRLALWDHISSRPAPEAIAGSPLAPAEIVNAARLAAAGADSIPGAMVANPQLLAEELFAPLACPYTWDDIVLPGALRDHLRELEWQIRLRSPVYEEWGFERLCPLGNGITALFAGPSGTGKTMAAQVLAGALRMRLYRVDLSGVMNKYIGETEKRLRRVFDACERADVVLFFDEADALFGQRTQVKDAHDRFANIEIDYLLQRMEQFNGVAILATNRKGDVDKAFLRRIRFIVDFVAPGPSERLAIWQRVLPARSPAGEELLGEIDWAYLAEKLNLTGAEIRGAALAAAFLARAAGGRIGMPHILHAAQREVTKSGMVLRTPGWGGQ